MDDIIALEARVADGTSRYFMTWGRIPERVDPRPIELIVRTAAGQFAIGGDVQSVRVCDTLREAASSEYFYEGFFHFCQERIPFGPHYQEWADGKLKALREGREIFYLGTTKAK